MAGRGGLNHQCDSPLFALQYPDAIPKDFLRVLDKLHLEISRCVLRPWGPLLDAFKSRYRWLQDSPCFPAFGGPFRQACLAIPFVKCCNDSRDSCTALSLLLWDSSTDSSGSFRSFAPNSQLVGKILFDALLRSSLLLGL